MISIYIPIRWDLKRYGCYFLCVCFSIYIPIRWDLKGHTLNNIEVIWKDLHSNKVRFKDDYLSKNRLAKMFIYIPIRWDLKFALQSVALVQRYLHSNKVRFKDETELGKLRFTACGCRRIYETLYHLHSNKVRFKENSVKNCYN